CPYSTGSVHLTLTSLYALAGLRRTGCRHVIPDVEVRDCLDNVLIGRWLETNMGRVLKSCILRKPKHILDVKHSKRINVRGSRGPGVSLLTTFFAILHQLGQRERCCRFEDGLEERSPAADAGPQRSVPREVIRNGCL